MSMRNCCTYCQNFWECHKTFSAEEQKKEKPCKKDSESENVPHETKDKK
jgi:hypothetical protein